MSKHNRKQKKMSRKLSNDTQTISRSVLNGSKHDIERLMALAMIVEL